MLLKIDNIRVFYGSFLAINGISLVIKEGEVVCILGANGAGKTTLVKSICGFVKPAFGSIEFNGEKIDRLASDEIIRKGISVCPEGGGCFPKMTVFKNLMIGAFTCNDNELIQKNYEKIIKLFPVLEERKYKLAGLLSGGERQMLAIGRALMGNPKLLILDEPSQGLAPLMIKSIYESLTSIQKGGETVLLVEQNAAQSLILADRGYVIELGKLVTYGDRKELLENETVKKAYMGL